MVWIYGGGFLEGAVSLYDPTLSIDYSVKLGLPYVWVGMNYRLSGFGFLAGKEASNAGILNLGIKDQRLALKWIKKYVSYFGGDPDKVTIYGESAGAVSVSLHLTAYAATKETDLFRAAITESGSTNTLVLPNSDFFQVVYDSVVSRAGCKDSNDTLECLRNVSYSTLASIIWSSNLPKLAILRPPFLPTLDGDLIPDVPFRLIKQGKFVKVPFMAGENLDEGTGFVNTINWSSDQLVRDAVSGSFPNMTQSSLDSIMNLYPNNLTLGSPYNTGSKTYYGAQGKRASSIYGDLFFTFPRRWQSEQISGFGVPTWNYRFDYNYYAGQENSATYLGVAHALEIISVYYYLPNPSSDAMAAYWPAFATNLNPNIGLKGLLPFWDQFNSTGRQQMRFEQQAAVLRTDDYRRNASQFVDTILEQMLGFTAPPSLLPTQISSSSSTNTNQNPSSNPTATTTSRNGSLGVVPLLAVILLSSVLTFAM
eukprot:TRINITY_DN5580_c0_g2_i1.p1 TRINITY_DN5580_c0_g2~~TRINITY_DN5580_c0_g2_i1.p1  ORF type:complete len:480 (+),score=129.07 TRINITY_DN5580_c0_g2_i1:404-1843(+)